MNLKGFTLVELLGVFAIICILIIILFPIVNSIITKSSDTAYYNQIDTILNATYDWSLKNLNKLPSSNKKVYVTLGELKQAGYVDNDIIDLKTNKPFLNNLVISISNVGNNYKVENKLSMTNGKYLYKVEIDFMSSKNFIKNKPIIKFDKFDYSNDNIYFLKLNIGQSFDEITYKATSYNNKDLTSYVIENITFNNYLVDKIDTNKLGIYKIYYIVCDDEGYSNISILNVVITDEEVPNIVLDKNITISSKVKNINLLQGVVCTDNTNNCDINIVGNVEFGTKGKYVIEYVAKDSFGNTTTKKRIITIE